MKTIALLAIIGAALIGPGQAAAREGFIMTSSKDGNYRHQGWSGGPMPTPDAEALRRAGIVQVKEIERDDGRLEVEGYDAQGREIKVYMDAEGKRVLSTRVKRYRED